MSKVLYYQNIIQKGTSMISLPTSYAIYALSRLNGPNGKYRLATEIAKEGDIPKDYLSKILHNLSRKNIVLSRRGVGGGFRLVTPPEEVSLFDVCVAMEDPICLKKCGLGLKICSDTSPCPIHSFWKNKREALLDELQRVKLNDVYESIIDTLPPKNSIKN